MRQRLCIVATLLLAGFGADRPARAVSPPIIPLPPIQSEGASEISPFPPVAPPPVSEPTPVMSGPIPFSLHDVREATLANNKNIEVVRHRHEGLLTSVEDLLGQFEPVYGVGLHGGHSYRQVRNIIESFGTSATEQETYFLRPEDDNMFFVQRRFMNGGFARLGFASDMMQVDPSDTGTFVNPGWDSSLRLRIEQPIFKGRGAAANTAPIEVARARAEVSIHDFQAHINRTLRDAERAYWNLECAQRVAELMGQFQSQTARMLERQKGRLELGRSSIPEVARTEERFSRSQADYARAVGEVRLAELRLRLLVGLPAIGGQTLVAVDSSDHVEITADLNEGISRAERRPEIQAQMAAIEAARQEACYQADGLRPDLTVVFDYAVTGLDESFDGSIGTLADHNFSDWRVGLLYLRPANQISQSARYRRANILVQREVAQMENVRHHLQNEVATAYTTMEVARQIVASQRQRLQAAEQDRVARKELYEKGRETLDQVFDAEDRYIEAAAEMKIAQRQFQNAQVEWRFATGTLTGEYVVLR